MRTRLITTTAALLLATASLATAQPPQTESSPGGVWVGTVSLGVQASSVTGDKARYERYRDLRNRQSLNIDLAREADKYFVDIKGFNIGNRDGFYALEYANRKLKFEFSFDQTPLNYSYSTMTPWTVSSLGSDVVLSLDQATRLSVQNKVPGVLGIPTSQAQWTGGRSVYAGLASPFDLQARRDTLRLALGYELTHDIDAEFVLTSHKRSGYQPFGAAFAFNNAAELPLPIDDRTTEFEVGVDWVHRKGMLRLAYERSMYTNSHASLSWDNPLRATDYSSAATTGWDSNGYSNGNGAARGRLAMAPDNTMSVVTATGLAKLARTTTLTGNLAVIDMSQNAALIPFTSNQVVAASTLCAGATGNVPCVASMPRGTAQAEVKGLNASFVFNTRPNRYVNVTARYRHNNHDNRTPAFSYLYNVRFDAVPEYSPGVETEPYTITQNRFDLDASFSFVPRTSLKVGYGYDGSSKTYLAYRKLTDNALRIAFDAVGNQYFMVRAMYERTRRTGSDFHQEAITDAGGQPNLRLFDDAERTRDRATLIATVTPLPILDVSVSYGRGKDDYDIGLDPQFGLLNNDNTVYSVGVNVAPKPQVAFGLSVGQEKFSALQQSRNANPFSGVAGAYESWNDPNRTWNLAHDETVRNVDLYVDLIKALPKTDLRLNYTFSDSDQAYVHGGPRVTAFQNNAILTTGDSRPCATGLASCFEAMPNVTNRWQRLTLDLRYHISKRVGVGASWWYEKLEVTDYATVDTNGPVGFYPATGVPRIDYLGEISMGYGNRPYTGNTGFVRVFYLF